MNALMFIGWFIIGWFIGELLRWMIDENNKNKR